MARTKRWFTLVMAFVLALNDAKAAKERKVRSNLLLI